MSGVAPTGVLGTCPHPQALNTAWWGEDEAEAAAEGGDEDMTTTAALSCWEWSRRGEVLSIW